MPQRPLGTLPILSCILAGSVALAQAQPEQTVADARFDSDVLAADDPFLGTQPVPEILTATRLRQAPAAVPGSVTVIDQALIRASGAREIPELLRLVPGMLVVPEGSLTTVNYHGSSASQARRLQVLVDGRSVYRPGFAQVDWHDIPLAIEDIQRIEVFRGPNTVSYGANALMAVVNIITFEPSEQLGTKLKTTQGERGIADWYAGHGESWTGGDLHLSLSGRQDDGFDEMADGNDARTGRRLSRLNLRARHELDARQRIDWQIALKEGSNQSYSDHVPTLPIDIEPGEIDRNADVTARDYAASLRWSFEPSSTHSLFVQTNLQQWERLRHWRSCDARVTFSPQLTELWSQMSAEQRLQMRNTGTFAASNPTQQALLDQVNTQLGADYDATSGTFAHVCGMIDEDVRENRFDLEIQDTLSLSDDLRLLSGASYRRDQTDSDTHLDGLMSRDIWRLFGHLEWYLDEQWLLQGGLMAEHDSIVGASLSPRLALNYLITPAHGLRLVYSQAVRSPDMFENDADWKYRVRQIDGLPNGATEALFFMTATGPGDLDQERMRSIEAGYNGRFTSLGLNMDVKIFHDVIDDLISHVPRIYNFAPDNDSRLELNGIETEMDWRAGVRDRLRLTYAYIEDDASNPLDENVTPRHSGSLAWLHDWQGGWNSSLIYHGADALNGYRFERADLRLSKRLTLGDAALELAGVWRQRLDDEPLSRADNVYDSRHVFYLSAELDF